MKKKLCILSCLFISMISFNVFASEKIGERIEVVRFNQLVGWAESEFRELFPGPKLMQVIRNGNLSTKELFPYDWVYRQYNSTQLALAMDKYETVYLFTFELGADGQIKDGTIRLLREPFGHLNQLIKDLGFDIEAVDRSALANDPIYSAREEYCDEYVYID